jgi:hypothetical protein
MLLNNGCGVKDKLLLVMTQKDKDLLVKDLCARLPYEDKVQYEDGIFTIDHISAMYEEVKLNTPNNYTIDVLEVKPYLFPLSSMTKEQRREYEWIIYRNIELHCERYYNVIDIDDFDCLMDFYHKNHLDYRGLIPMGLANNATGLNIY